MNTILKAVFFNKIVDLLISKLTNLYLRVFHDRVKLQLGKSCLENIENKGDGCKFKGMVRVYYDYGLTLGNHVRIGEDTFIFAMGGVYIKDNTQISRNVTIYSANHDINGTHIPYDSNYICKPVKIGNSVWIGMNVQILPGVTIGDGAVIGMGAVISKDVQAGEVVVGASQRVVSKRDLTQFYNKQNSELYFAKEWPEK